MSAHTHYTDPKLRTLHASTLRTRFLSDRIDQLKEAMRAGDSAAFDAVYNDTLHELRYKFLEGKQMPLPLRTIEHHQAHTIQQLKLFAA